jgi:hypothetical protein
MKRPKDVANDIADYGFAKYADYGVEFTTRNFERYKSEKFIELVIRIPNNDDFLKKKKKEEIEQ